MRPVRPNDVVVAIAVAAISFSVLPRTSSSVPFVAAAVEFATGAPSIPVAFTPASVDAVRRRRRRDGCSFQRGDYGHWTRKDPTTFPLASSPDDLFFGDAASTILTSLETFDGSTVVDPVVVGGAFWGSLQVKILSVVIGQLLAAAAFAVLSSVASKQLSNMGQFISDKLSDKASRQEASANVAKFSTAAAEKLKPQTFQPDFGKLLICLAIDAVGSSSELIPILGEVTDVVWAPIAAVTLRNLYGSDTLLFLEFAEEILPFTDVLPLATLCWAVETFYADSDVARALGIGNYGARGTVIDVKADSDDQRGVKMLSGTQMEEKKP